MASPYHPLSLTAEQLGDLNRKLSNLRHDVNNHLSNIMAAATVMRCKPQMAERMMVTFAEQPPKIKQALDAFSAEFKQAFGRLAPGFERLFVLLNEKQSERQLGAWRAAVRSP